MTFKEAKIGDYVFRPEPGISYKRSIKVVLQKATQTIVLIDGTRPGDVRTLTDRQFDEADYQAVTGQMVAREFSDV